MESLEGPGKYGEEAEFVRQLTQAKTVLLIIEDGSKGSGFSVVTRDPDARFRLPMVLRHMADEIEQSIDAAKQS